MAWLETISSILGVGVGGMLAVSIYKGATVVEKEMRADARIQIAEFIKRTNFRPSLEIIADLVKHIFEIIFGDKHFSKKCIWRSFLASFVFWIFFIIVFFLKFPGYVKAGIKVENPMVELSVLVLMIFILSCIPDYISLYK